jgi:hypothetical protein
VPSRTSAYACFFSSFAAGFVASFAAGFVAGGSASSAIVQVIARRVFGIAASPKTYRNQTNR